MQTGRRTNRSHSPAERDRGRTAWRELLHQASKHRADLILVWRIDRAFRSVLDAATTLERLRGWNVGLRSYSEPWLDMTSPCGEALYYITVAYAQLERGIISERVRAGMDRAKRQGKRLGRPRAASAEWARVRPLIESGAMSQRQAARVLGVGRSTVGRLLAQNAGGNGDPRSFTQQAVRSLERPEKSSFWAGARYRPGPALM